MAVLGLVKNITTRTGVAATTSFTSIRQISIDRNSGSSGSVVASAVAAIHFNGSALRNNKEPMEEFSFSFTYTSPCPCNGLAPCGEGIFSPPGCGCSGGVVIGPTGTTTCTDIWDEALMHCKTLTLQTHLDGLETSYNFTTGTAYFYQV